MVRSFRRELIGVSVSAKHCYIDYAEHFISAVSKTQYWFNVDK